MLVALALCAVPLRSATLREALAANGVDSQGLDAARLVFTLTSYSALNEADVFVIAYFRADRKLPGDVLYVDLLNKRQGQWISSHVGGLEETGETIWALGNSVTGITRAGEFYYISTHLNPSAGFTVALTSSLAFVETLFGWPLAAFPDGFLIFQDSEIHFAPTHYTEISVFDPHTKRTWLIYPRKPYQQIRLEHIAKVRAAYDKRGEEWFKEHNHHGNPELFDNFRKGEVAANPQSHAVAFRLAFDNTDTWEYAEKMKFQQFGGIGRGLQDVAFSPRPPESAYFLLGEWLGRLRRQELQDQFLELFKHHSQVQEMLRKAFELPEHSQESWQPRLLSLDPRWGDPEVWKALRQVLETPPETTEVVCFLRNIDQENEVECREILATDYEKRFGDLSLEELLTPKGLSEVFGK